MVLLLFLVQVRIHAQNVRTSSFRIKNDLSFRMSNENVSFTVVFKDQLLLSDTLDGNNAWLQTHGSNPFSLVTDGGFGLNFVWTDWQAPGKASNADNPVLLDKKDFLLTGNSFKSLDNGGAELVLFFKGNDIPVLMEMTCRLDPGTFYVKRKIAVRDTLQGTHFLDKFMARYGRIGGYGYSKSKPGKLLPDKANIIKQGEFGQPVAIRFSTTGCFFGLEYPASTNSVTAGEDGSCFINCEQEIGSRVGKEPLESEWVVEALVPESNVKDWFFRYVNDIRVMPAKPYSLYNSWYDLRSPEYPGVKPGHVMNEENAFNIIRVFRKNMIEKHHISLDAFVLDDGWDVYQSDWELRKETFPNGLRPLADTLQKMGTLLGLWMGPTGGYSFRMKRINWMKEHGYEVVGTGRDYSMLCLGGTKYSGLFRKRITDFVSNSGVAYFKWDGIQFSCSEPDHGHPTGIYSRRAIMESIIDKCQAVRAINPKVYLNITSGTWLSPWWVKYANQIWMQGEDYGYADVPSISQRDAAMTYKDMVLYDDFKNHDWWFPVANLMTHGIIKGNLETLGGEDDPPEKFTNDMVFYLARGVSMYELYISPDLLSEKEWDAEGSAIAWAKDRYNVLSNTYMTGGDPKKRECYGYIHLRGNHGIVAVRNPVITASVITIHLSPEYGLDPKASGLVLDKVYPYRWISGRLFASGSSIEIPLEGFETALFEIYPLNEAKEPLVCDARYKVTGITDDSYKIRVYYAPFGIRLLNPGSGKPVGSGGESVTAGSGRSGTLLPPAIVSRERIHITKSISGTEFSSKINFDPSVKEIRYAVLLTPDKESLKNEFPVFTIFMDGKEKKVYTQQQAGLWSWISAVSEAPVAEIKVLVKNKDKSPGWKGKASVYAICRQSVKGKEIIFSTPHRVKEKPMLPDPFGEGISEKTVWVDEFNLDTTDAK
jgi:hypothetical protein